MKKAKCCYCGREINAFELASCEYNGKKKWCHTGCHIEHIEKGDEDAVSGRKY